MIEKIKNKIGSDKHFVELLRGSSISFFLKITGMLIGYIVVLYITNTFGAHEFGILTLCITLVAIFSLIPKFGMEFALVRIISELFTLKRFSEIRQVFKLVFIGSGTLAIIFIIVLYIGADIITDKILDKVYIKDYLQIASIAIITTAMTAIVSATLQGLKKTKKFVFIQAILMQLIFIVFLLLNNIVKITDNLVIIYVLSNVVSTLIAMAILLNTFNNFKEQGIKEVYKYDLLKIINVSFPMLFSGSIAMLMSWTDIIMLGIFKSESEVGVYGVVLKLAGLTGIALVAINSVSVPKFVEFYINKNLKGLEKIVKQSTKLIFITSFPLLLLYLFFSKTIMGIFGDEFIIGAMALIIISLGQFINAISGSVGYIMQMTDNQKIFQNVIIIASLLNITLNYFLIPMYGINGAAIASMISMMFWNITLVIFIKNKLGFWTIYIPFSKRII